MNKLCSADLPITVHFYVFFKISTARKTKKKIKGIQQATTGVSQETSENPANKTIVPATLPQLTPTLVSLLEVIEPEVLYAGYDSSVPDSTWRIMTTLNMLGGRQVIAAVKWAKAIPGKMQKIKEQLYKPLCFLRQKHFGFYIILNPWLIFFLLLVLGTMKGRVR